MAKGTKSRWFLELEAEAATAAAAAFREALAGVAPEHPLLLVRDPGRMVLDRLRAAEEVSHDSVVDGLFQLRDALSRALGLVVVGNGTVNEYRACTEILNRWGERHLRLTKKGKAHDGDTRARADGGSGEHESEEEGA